MFDFIHQNFEGTPVWGWAIFAAIFVGMLAADLFFVNRHAHETSRKEAVTWVCIWIALGVAFGIGVNFWKGTPTAIEYATAYVVEYSLSIDNIFLFILIFNYFGIQPKYRHRVLFWGVLGAVIMRAIFIGAGVTLIARFHWILYIFGAFLLYTGLKLIFSGENEEDPRKSPIVKYAKKYLPFTDRVDSEAFFLVENGKRIFTPLFLVLLVVEFTDLVFAVDSIPACMAVTQDPFILYTSNIFAIMGLRSLYFVLSGFLGGLRFLKPALAFILLLIGAKIILKEAQLYELPTLVSLGLIAGALFLAVLLSLKFPSKELEELKETKKPEDVIV